MDRCHYYAVVRNNEIVDRFADFDTAMKAASALLQAIADVATQAASQEPSVPEVEKAQARLRENVLHVQYSLKGQSGYLKHDHEIPQMDLETVEQALADGEQTTSMFGSPTPYTVATIENVAGAPGMVNLKVAEALLTTFELPLVQPVGDLEVNRIEKGFDDDDAAEFGYELYSVTKQEVIDSATVVIFTAEREVVKAVKALLEDGSVLGDEKRDYDDLLDAFVTLSL